MNTKPTLTIESGIIEEAKRVARQSGMSLSALIENYLVSLIALHKSTSSSAQAEAGERLLVAEPELTYSSRLQSLKGVAKDDGLDYKEQLADAKRKKLL